MIEFNDFDVKTQERQKGPGYAGSKIAFIESALFHAKSYDSLMFVNDIDELLVSMDPQNIKVTKMIELLAYGVDGLLTTEPDICTAMISGYQVKEKSNKNGKHLADAYQVRCNDKDGYNKSLVVLKNADFGGIHIHQICRSKEYPFYLNPLNVTYHHYENLWRTRDVTTEWRYQCNSDPNITSEFVLAHQTFGRLSHN